MRNVYQAIDLRSRLRGESSGAVLTNAYNAFISSGARFQALKDQHQADALALRRKENRDIAKAREAARLEKDFAMDVHRDAFLSKR